MNDDLATWRMQFAPEILGESPAILEALDATRHVAATDCSILITGETGAGKELFARAAHRASRRRGSPFIPVNCAAIPDQLLESELFGHVKGAFTGATGSRTGRFMSAHEGTIFLDEIGDMPLAAQAKLLRVLEERVVSPVGSDSDIPVDVRVIAATHRNLEEMVAQGKFRADLYFRLAVVPIVLPSLRERPEDIEIIAERCIKRFRERTGRNVEGLDNGARAALRAYHWPGNARELCHLVERAVLLARRSILSAEDLQIPGSPTRYTRATAAAVQLPTPAAPVPSRDGIAFADGTGVNLPIIASTPPAPAAKAPLVSDDSLDLRSALENLERTLIERALHKAGGNRTEAAALLGLNRTTLVEKLRKYAA